jgi:membrane-associated phospholipid phosphatase
MEKDEKLNISKSKRVGLIVSELIGVTGLSMLSVWGVFRITSKLQINQLQPFKTDIKVMNLLDGLKSPILTKVMEAVTSLANFKGITLIAGALTYGFFSSKKNKVYSFEIPVIAIGGEILNLIFKSKYRRVRPVGHALRVYGWSYPSGHAMASISFYGFLIYLLAFKSHFSKEMISGGSFILILLILLIGLSRSYLKAHFPSDVVAGYALGFLWLVGSLSMVHQLEEFISNKDKRLRNKAHLKSA